MSGVRLSRALLPHMLERNWGRIIFIPSESGVQIPSEMLHYGVTKTAQLALSRGIAESVAGTGITVNAVLPGPTRSEGAVTFLDKMAADRGVRVEDHEKEFIKTNRPSSLIQRFAEPEEVATRLSISVAKPLAPPRALHYVSMVAWCGAFFSPGTKDLIAGQSLNRV